MYQGIIKDQRKGYSIVGEVVLLRVDVKSV